MIDLREVAQAARAIGADVVSFGVRREPYEYLVSLPGVSHSVTFYDTPDEGAYVIGVICSPACDHLSTACRGGPTAAADFARTWLPEEAREQWEERVAIQAAEGVAMPEVRALVLVWRQLTVEIDPSTIRRL